MASGFSPSEQVGVVRLAAGLAKLRDAWLAERERWPLWLPALLGSGVGAYFVLPFEPWAWTGPGGLFGCMVLAWLVRGRPALFVLCLAVLFAAGGFAAAQLAAWRAAAPVIEREVGPLTIVGRVAAVEAAAGGQRLTLDRLDLGTQRVTAPQRARLRVSAAVTVHPGQFVRVRAMLMPPQPPAMPGAFDFARQAWFQSIGAVGYAVGKPEVLPGSEEVRWYEFAAMWLADARHAATLRIIDAIGGPAGAVAAALITGESAAIPERLLDAYRDSGLAHLLSISGLHMSMVAGFVFVVVRRGLALLEPVALRHPIKKWAAVAAVVAGLAYLLLAGAPVPTQRAFLMIGLVFLGVLVDRNPLSLRLVAWSAVAVLLWQPQALTGASFQMSFAAVVALVAAYEGLGPRLAAWRGRDRGWAIRAAFYVGGVALTTLVAGSATAVYGLYHFNRVTSYALAANLLAVPITGVWVMPCALTAMLLMPFGLEGPALTVMGWGVEAVNRIAGSVAGWPGAAFAAPTMPHYGLVAFTLGGLWLCLWQGRWRWWGVAAMAGALLTIGLSRPPDILVDGDGKAMAVRSGDGALVMAVERGDAFSRDMWLRRAGGGLPLAKPPREGLSADGRLSCDGAGCIYQTGGRTVALVKSIAAAQEDCAMATVVISAVPLRRVCQGPLVVDRFDLWRHGAHALWLEPDGVILESVAQWQGRRPWARWPQ